MDKFRVFKEELVRPLRDDEFELRERRDEDFLRLPLPLLSGTSEEDNLRKREQELFRPLDFVSTERRDDDFLRVKEM